MRQLEIEFGISITGSRELTKDEVQRALQELFGRGAETIIQAFEIELKKLPNGAH